MDVSREQGERRSFVAPTKAQALEALRAAFGPDAMIISERKVTRSGPLGLGSKCMIEVVGQLPFHAPPRVVLRDSAGGVSSDAILRVIEAGRRTTNKRRGGGWIEDSDPTRPLAFEESAPHRDGAAGITWREALMKPTSFTAYESQKPVARRRAPGDENDWLRDPASRFRGTRAARLLEEATTRKEKRPVAVKAVAESRPSSLDVDRIKAELKREIMRELGGNADAQAERDAGPVFPGESAPVIAVDVVEERKVTAAAVHAPAASSGGVLPVMRRRLEEAGVDATLVETILENVSRRTQASEWDDEPVVLARVRKEISGMVRVAPPLEPPDDRPLIVMAVGATGVGKTTTLAKLGASFAIDEGRSVTFLTLDRYRIAAVEQLRTYSEILNAPFEAVTDARELREAIDRHVDREVILVDTAGRSAHEPSGLEELKKLIDALDEDSEILLLVSSNTDTREMTNVIRNFSIGRRMRLVFTKVDETLRWGSIFNAAVECRIPIGYWTTGQSVPNDIEPALPLRLAQALLGEETPGREPAGEERERP